jgi:hypothetical protein
MTVFCAPLIVALEVIVLTTQSHVLMAIHALPTAASTATVFSSLSLTAPIPATCLFAQTAFRAPLIHALTATVSILPLIAMTTTPALQIHAITAPAFILFCLTAA